MKLLKTYLSLFAFCMMLHAPLMAQCVDGLTPIGQPCGGTLGTAVPFLRIIQDARSGGMGDVGIALSPDANSILYNASKMAMADKKWGASVNYAPWLRNLSIRDIYYLHGAGYYQFGGSKKQAIGVSVTRFSLGTIQYTDINGQPLNNISEPHEEAFSLAYARTLNAHWALGATVKYIQSDLATGIIPSGTTTPIQTGRAFAIDASATYTTPLSIFSKEATWTAAAALSNLGNKITYLRTSDVLPANIGIGGALDMEINRNHRLLVSMEFNKLLVPSPRPNDNIDLNGNRIPDWREVGVVKGMLKSFGDAPNGFKEEMQEINTSIGLEYWCMRHIALRAGYFHENRLKGNRKYLTIGGGVRYRSIGINMSYLMATSDQRSALDNTWRLSLLLNGFHLKTLRRVPPQYFEVELY
jgi:hypothetical protein